MAQTSPIVTTSPELFHNVFNASPIGIVVENMDGQPLFVNPAFCSFLGFTEQELHSKHCVDFSPPEDAAKDWVLFQQLRAGSIDHYQLEKRYFRKDGSLVWGSLSISLLKSHPSPLVIAMVEDITARKAAEEGRFRHTAIVESAQDAIISKNLEARITTWNACAERIFGYTEEEAVGQPITIIIPPYLQDEENEILTRLKAGGRIEHYETKRLTKTGTEVDVSLTIGPIKDATGCVVGFSKIAHEITERKRAEEELQESEEKFRSVFRDAGIGMVIVSPDGRFLAANKAFCECLGYTEEELRARTVESVTFKEDWPPFSQKLREAVAEGRNFQWFEKRCLHKSGRIVNTETSASLIRSKDGAPRYFVAEVLDVTSRIQAQLALSEMTRKLIEAQEQERARMGRELHDDINQRLSMLAVELEQLQDDPSDFPRRALELRRQTDEISRDVQALSHELHSSKLEYLGVVAGIRSWCREFAERQKIVVDFTGDVSIVFPPEVGLTLFRVLQEGLHNAVKHSGVKRVEVQIHKHLGEIHLIINDMGNGFDIEMVQGNGLGLTSMRERVRLVNGTIDIQSKPTSGTTLHVRVPFKPGPTPNRPPDNTEIFH
jgi:PAS domain S-box-containing protein